jgi:hypothetical protein
MNSIAIAATTRPAMSDYDEKGKPNPNKIRQGMNMYRKKDD